MLKPGLAMYGRHHAVQECIIALCRSAGVAARTEVLVDSSNNRPADVYLPCWSHGVSYAIDVTVSHPSQANNASRDGESEGTSASVRAAMAKVVAKNTKYQQQCEAQGIKFVAAAVCCFGGWLEEAEAIIIRLAERSTARLGAALPMVKSEFWQRLSIVLWRGTASQILHYA